MNYISIKFQPKSKDSASFTVQKTINNKKDIREEYILVLDCECELIGLGKWNSQLSKLQPKIVINAAG